jgi:hypothetical protein
MTKKTIIGGVASLAAVAAIAVGGVAASSGSAGSSPTAPGNAAASTTATPAPNGSPPAGGRLGAPGGGRMGTPATGAAADKAKAAALAKYPGTAERVLKTPDGGYLVHVIKKDGSEARVLVSAAFQVTGVQTGGPPGGQAPA